MAIGLALIGAGIFIKEQHLVRDFPLQSKTNMHAGRRQDMPGPRPASRLLTQSQIMRSAGSRCRHLL